MDSVSASLSGTDESVPLQNLSFLEFKTRLESAGVRVFDPGPGLIQRKKALRNIPLYLESDTHWRPETMEFVAQNLAAFIQAPRSAQRASLRIAEKEIDGLGDIARMLRLPPTQNMYRPEKVTIHQVLSGNAMWNPRKEADILLLGDSFSNIFSLDALGWGESAGLAEHLCRALDGRSLDCILRNSDAAFATREILSRELARGRDRLLGKELVVWEFATRELTFGDWKLLDMKLKEAPPARFFVPKTNEETVVTGTIEAISTVPRPGTVPYRDHIVAVHLTDLTGAQIREEERLESLVYLLSMRDGMLTPATRLRLGDQVILRLRPWADVAGQYEKINRSEVEDLNVQLQEPCWGEIAR
jgi:hypothetical protein